jgi:hypothetical protein
MSVPLNLWLMCAAGLSAVAGLLHLGIIVGGAPWYRYFGAGEDMARMAQAGSWYPALITAGIASVLFLWSAYALAGAGWPLAQGVFAWQRPVLGLITAVYLLRGLAIVPWLLFKPALVSPFMLWSSVICCGFGLIHLQGVLQVWSRL